jgi:prepilin-type N-terminal cleavage/methylation domain-containing protein
MKSHRNAEGGFTLLELLAAMAVLVVMIAMLFAAFSQASRAWLQGENRVETFTQARAALDYMSKELSQAIVTTNGPPGGLQGLQFLGTNNSLAFIAPVNNNPGGGGDLMEVVYRLSYQVSNDTVFTEGFNVLPKKLVRRVSMASSGTICENYYASTVAGSGNGCPNAWDLFTSADWPETGDFNNTAVLAENVVSLNFVFVSTNNDQYSYWNSTENRGVLPPNLPGSYTPWTHEILGIPGGIEYNLRDVNNTPGTEGAQFMTNHAPAGVVITIEVIDSRAATRLKAVGLGTPPWVAIINQAKKSFTTFVNIPNSQP